MVRCGIVNKKANRGAICSLVDFSVKRYFFILPYPLSKAGFQP